MNLKNTPFSFLVLEMLFLKEKKSSISSCLIPFGLVIFYPLLEKHVLVKATILFRAAFFQNSYLMYLSLFYSFKILIFIVVAENYIYLYC